MIAPIFYDLPNDVIVISSLFFECLTSSFLALNGFSSLALFCRRHEKAEKDCHIVYLDGPPSYNKVETMWFPFGIPANNDTRGKTAGYFNCPSWNISINDSTALLSNFDCPAESLNPWQYKKSWTFVGLLKKMSFLQHFVSIPTSVRSFLFCQVFFGLKLYWRTKFQSYCWAPVRRNAERKPYGLDIRQDLFLVQYGILLL